MAATAPAPAPAREKPILSRCCSAQPDGKPSLKFDIPPAPRFTTTIVPELTPGEFVNAQVLDSGGVAGGEEDEDYDGGRRVRQRS